jgi:translation initiation factor eIF-2B subunit delta
LKTTTTKQERRELQEKQRAEKAQRIAQGLPQKAPQKQKQKQQNSPPRNPEVQYRPPPQKKKTLKRQSDAEQVSLSLFSHLKPYSSIDDVVLRDKIATGLIHPTIISLGNQYSEMVITGGNARCIALMQGFKKVISDYITPSGTSLHRHLTTYISKQVDFLTVCRPLSASMKTAIRQIKFDISNLDSSLPDEDAKKKLCDSIGEFVNMRIELAQEGIVEAVLTKNKKIKNGDCILTFGR